MASPWKAWSRRGFLDLVHLSNGIIKHMKAAGGFATALENWASSTEQRLLPDMMNAELKVRARQTATTDCVGKCEQTR